VGVIAPLCLMHNTPAFQLHPQTTNYIVIIYIILYILSARSQREGPKKYFCAVISSLYVMRVQAFLQRWIDSHQLLYAHMCMSAHLMLLTLRHAYVHRHTHTHTCTLSCTHIAHIHIAFVGRCSPDRKTLQPSRALRQLCEAISSPAAAASATATAEDPRCEHYRGQRHSRGQH
jgi:hypothetical protein